MNKLAKIGGIGVGSFLLFTSAFIVFTALSGVPLKDVAVLGSFIGESDEPELPSEKASPEVEPIKTDGEVLEASVGVLDAFLIESPFDANGLHSLQDELKGKIRELEERRRRIREREQELEEREEFLDMRYTELMKLRATLEDFESELHARSAEVERDDRAQKQREKQSWKKLARTFEEGDPEELSERLILYPADDAARILHALEDERAGFLLNALPAEKYKDYADAYLKFREGE